MSIPVYTIPTLTKELLRDSLMDDVLDYFDTDRDFPNDVARNAAYQWMAHSAVWTKELHAFKQAVLQYGFDGIAPHSSDVDDLTCLGMVSRLSDHIQLSMNRLAADSYANEKLVPDRVESAMVKHDIGVDLETMRMLLADLAVGGEEFVQQDDSQAMDEEGITLEMLKQIAADYQAA